MAEGQKKSVWMYVGIGCAGLLLLVIVTCVGFGFYAKKKLEQAGGPQAFATQMITMGGGIIALPALPEGERAEARKVLDGLQEKAKTFTKDDVKDLGKAMERLSQAQKASPDHKPTAEEARAFVAECKQIADRH
ncbi:MAG: hypothetical protein IPN59_07025 [Holophaga sp.]|nr:hypothetical protein [Holophaga sp.]